MGQVVIHEMQRLSLQAFWKAHPEHRLYKRKLDHSKNRFRVYDSELQPVFDKMGKEAYQSCLPLFKNIPLCFLHASEKPCVERGCEKAADSNSINILHLHIAYLKDILYCLIWKAAEHLDSLYPLFCCGSYKLSILQYACP